MHVPPGHAKLVLPGQAGDTTNKEIDVNLTDMTDNQIQTAGLKAEADIRNATAKRDDASAKVNAVVREAIDAGKSDIRVEEHDRIQGELDKALEALRVADKVLTALHSWHVALAQEAWHRGVAKINANN